jgi:hypothetical protein
MNREFKIILIFCIIFAISSKDCTKKCGGCKKGRCDVFGCNGGLYCCSGNIVDPNFGACCSTCGDDPPPEPTPENCTKVIEGKCTECKQGYWGEKCQALCSDQCIQGCSIKSGGCIGCKENNDCCKSCVSNCQNCGFEEGFDRPGSDYSTSIQCEGPGDCSQLCENDEKCKAWTYVYPGPKQGCYLKDNVPGKTDLNKVNSVSGVKKNYIPPKCSNNGKMTSKKDRNGGDYKTLITDGPKGCCAECEKDEQCQTWTYVEIDPYQGCHLKNELVKESSSSCDQCTSGLSCGTNSNMVKSVKKCKQMCSNWCWSTSIAQALSLMKHTDLCSTTQLTCDLESAITGQDCCKIKTSEDCALYEACNQGNSLDGIYSYVKQIIPEGNWKLAGPGSSLNPKTLAKSLEKGFPVFLMITWSGGIFTKSGHVYLLAGYECNAENGHQFILANPDKDNFELISWDKLLEGEGWKWTDTIYSEFK